MTLSTSDYAALSDAVYVDPVVDQRAPDGRVLSYKIVELNGKLYQPIAHADDPKTGFQATAYERVGTHETVIAYRGTEMSRELKQDLLTTDVSMAFQGVNTQGPDADAFTKKVIAEATQKAEQYGYAPSITVTGHSLGGTEAEMNAFKYHLKGETFNAFGAAGLSGLNIPEGGNQVIDHVRATDFVSAASPHFGQVRIYAVPQDIQALKTAGYHDNRLLNDLLPNEPILGSIQIDAHKMGNFLPHNEVTGNAIITPQNEALAKEHANMIGEYRGEVMGARNFSHTQYEAEKPTMDATGAMVNRIKNDVKQTGEFLGAFKDKAVEDYHDTVNATSRGIEGAVGLAHKAYPVLLDHPAHPDYMLFQQSLGAVHRLDAQLGRTPDQHSSNLAAGITVGAKANGLTKVDHVVLSTDGANAFAVQGTLGSPTQQVARAVDTSQAVNTPIEQHTQSMLQVNQSQQQAQQQVQQVMQVQQPQQHGPAIGR
jgi:hypothetical protein